MRIIFKWHQLSCRIKIFLLWYITTLLITSKIIRPVEKEGWSSNICKLWDSSCFGILRKSFLMILLVIRLKGGRNQFFGLELGPKVRQLPQIHIWRTTARRKMVVLPKWQQDMVYFGWSKICIPLRETEVL